MHVKTQFPCGRAFRNLAVALLSGWIPAVALHAANVPSDSVSLAWDPNPESNVVGYKVRFGAASGVYSQVIDVVGATSAVLPQMILGTTYYMTVSAYNTAGQEGVPSAEFAVTPVLPQPAAGTAFTLGGSGNGALEWKYPLGSGAPAERFAIYASEDLVHWSVAGILLPDEAVRTDGQWSYFRFPFAADRPRKFFQVGSINPFGESK